MASGAVPLAPRSAPYGRVLLAVVLTGLMYVLCCVHGQTSAQQSAPVPVSAASAVLDSHGHGVHAHHCEGEPESGPATARSVAPHRPDHAGTPVCAPVGGSRADGAPPGPERTPGHGVDHARARAALGVWRA
ncbi:hypothetical protein I5Q34_11140 [Streptomyces sp. AV19]|uniref:hypothetical protein n=1 Tax=Streptomyces sp. AV19 TaxID=2793068 RepID=UPI0018FF0EED|nr:hypothetical protein [Streptomyces sp. AV19]MBH1934825.1 hypothetical protein [Streptomyces sp. AV19]MDG4530570.1 hypothetical protein [Streptomyces sp. AV19]